MGTSGSYGGPGGGPGLLPDWAFPPEAAGQPPGTQQPPSQLPVPPALVGPWIAAKTNLTRYASGSSRSPREAARSYVAAKGGARSAMRHATSGRAMVAGMAFFLTTAATKGIGVAFETLGLSGIVGQNAEVVLAAIANAIAPDGSSLESSAARKATADLLAALYDRYFSDAGDLTAFEEMKADDIREVVEESVSAYIYNRWLQELGLSIEKGAVSIAEAIRLERELKAYVRECVRLELAERDALAINWSGREGHQIIESVFQDAYALLEVSQ